MYVLVLLITTLRDLNLNFVKEFKICDLAATTVRVPNQKRSTQINYHFSLQYVLIISQQISMHKLSEMQKRVMSYRMAPSCIMFNLVRTKTKTTGKLKRGRMAFSNSVNLGEFMMKKASCPVTKSVKIHININQLNQRTDGTIRNFGSLSELAAIVSFRI